MKQFFKKFLIWILSFIATTLLFFEVSIVSTKYILFSSDFNRTQIDKISLNDFKDRALANTDVAQYKDLIKITPEIEAKIKEMLSKNAKAVTDYLTGKTNEFDINFNFKELKMLANDPYTKQFLSGFPDSINSEDIAKELKSGATIPPEIVNLKRNVLIARYILTDLPGLLLIISVFLIGFAILIDAVTTLKFFKNKILISAITYGAMAIGFWYLQGKLPSSLPAEYAALQSVISPYVLRSFNVFFIEALILLAISIALYFLHRKITIQQKSQLQR